MQLNYNKSSWAILASIRFLMAVIVLIGHLHVFTDLPESFSFIRSLGNKAAVLGFLIISGLSIGTSYVKSPQGFIARRFLRIYPLYFFAVLVTIVVQYVIGSPFKIPGQTMVTAGWLTSIGNFFFLQGFLTISITYNGPLWSLAVEVFFYLLVPLFARIKTYILIALILLSFGVYYFYFNKDLLYGFAALKFAWPWLIGFLFATRKVNKVILAILFSIGTICTYDVLSYGNESLSYVTFFLVACSVLIMDNRRFNLNGTFLKGFAFLGELSYPLYLFHMPVYLILYYLGVRNAYMFCVFLLILIVLVNYLFDHWLKRVFWRPMVIRVSDNWRLLLLN